MRNWGKETGGDCAGDDLVQSAHGRGGTKKIIERARRRAYKKGHAAETRAAIWLRFKGWRILEKRYKTSVGEIDLIALRGGTIAFIEVKARATRAEALLAINQKTRQRISAAARVWLSAHPWAMELTQRYDAMLIVRRRLPEHVENIFSAARAGV